MPEPTGSNLGDLAAAYAALLATGVAFVQGITYLRNRPRLRLTLVETYLNVDDVDDHGPAIVVLQVVNQSSRPVAIQDAGVILRSGQLVSFPGEGRRDPLPEGYPLMYQLDRDALIGELIDYGSGTRIGYTYARDYFGKVHRAKVAAEWASFGAAVVDDLGAKRAARRAQQT